MDINRPSALAHQPRRLEPALHAALRVQPHSLARVRAVVAALDEGSLLAAVNEKTAAGITPLMIAVQGGGGGDRRKGRDKEANAAALATGFPSTLIGAAERRAETERIVDFLLEAGAGLSICAKTQSRLTAADYARQLGKQGAALAARLRALQVASLATHAAGEATAATGAAPRQPLRCALCGDQLRGGCKFTQAST